MQPEQAPRVQETEPEQRQNDDGPEQVDPAPQKLAGHGQAEGVVHGAHHARPPQQKAVESRQRSVPERHVGQKHIPKPRDKQEDAREHGNEEYQRRNPAIKGDERHFVLAPGQGVVKTGGRAHVQKAGKLREHAGGEVEVPVDLRPERAREHRLHDQIDGDGGDVRQQLAHIAACQRSLRGPLVRRLIRVGRLIGG